MALLWEGMCCPLCERLIDPDAGDFIAFPCVGITDPRYESLDDSAVHRACLNVWRKRDHFCHAIQRSPGHLPESSATVPGRERRRPGVLERRRRRLNEGRLPLVGCVKRTNCNIRLRVECTTAVNIFRLAGAAASPSQDVADGLPRSGTLSRAFASAPSSAALAASSAATSTTALSTTR